MTKSSSGHRSRWADKGEVIPKSVEYLFSRNGTDVRCVFRKRENQNEEDKNKITGGAGQKVSIRLQDHCSQNRT